MNLPKMEESELGQTKEPVEVIDCGRASECTRGDSIGWYTEFTRPPFDFFVP